MTNFTDEHKYTDAGKSGREKKKKKDNAAGLFQEYQYGNIMYG